MPVLEPMPGLRVVADPAALDRASWRGDDVIVLRIAPDEALAIRATSVAIDDDHAIIEPEAGFVGSSGWSLDGLRAHIEWSIPTARPVLAQGSVAGVPARLWLTAGDRVLLVTAAAHADVLAERLPR